VGLDGVVDSTIDGIISAEGTGGVFGTGGRGGAGGIDGATDVPLGASGSGGVNGNGGGIGAGGGATGTGGGVGTGGMVGSGGIVGTGGASCVPTTYYRDFDGDGYGDPRTSTSSCALPPGYVANSGDCDDTDVSVHAGTAYCQNSMTLRHCGNDGQYTNTSCTYQCAFGQCASLATVDIAGHSNVWTNVTVE
jgi:hypothetical protein